MATDLNTAGMKTASTAKMPAHKRMSPTTSMSDLYSSDSVEIVATPDIAPPHKTLAEMLEPRLWSMLVLAGLAVSLPLVATCTAIVALLQRLFGKAPEAVPYNGKTAIVSGGKMTKSFVLIKQLKAQGCRVVLVETDKYWMVASRFSNCVDRFVTVPVPEKEPEAYVAAMVRLAEEEKADIFVPVTSPVASAYEARLNAALPSHCFSWSLPPEEVEALDDKVILCSCNPSPRPGPPTSPRPSPPHRAPAPPPRYGTSLRHSPPHRATRPSQVVFCRSAEALGLPVPVAHRVSSHAEVIAWNERLAALVAAEPDAKHPRYIFKNLQYDSMLTVVARLGRAAAPPGSCASCASSPQAAPGGPVQLGTPRRVAPGHWGPPPRPQLLERAASRLPKASQSHQSRSSHCVCSLRSCLSTLTSPRHHPSKTPQATRGSTPTASRTAGSRRAHARPMAAGATSSSRVSTTQPTWPSASRLRRRHRCRRRRRWCPCPSGATPSFTAATHGSSSGCRRRTP